MIDSQCFYSVVVSTLDFESNNTSSNLVRSEACCCCCCRNALKNQKSNI